MLGIGKFGVALMLLSWGHPLLEFVVTYSADVFRGCACDIEELRDGGEAECAFEPPAFLYSYRWGGSGHTCIHSWDVRGHSFCV